MGFFEEEMNISSNEGGNHKISYYILRIKNDSR